MTFLSSWACTWIKSFVHVGLNASVECLLVHVWTHMEPVAFASRAM